MKTIVKEIIMLLQNIINCSTGSQTDDKAVPGGLNNLHHHVVAQVLDQNQHLLSETEGRMIDLERVT